MKANYDANSAKDSELQKLEELWKAELNKASVSGVILGGQGALKLSYDRFAKDIRPGKGNTQKSRLAAAEELLVYLENKSKGLKDSAQEE